MYLRAKLTSPGSCHARCAAELNHIPGAGGLAKQVLGTLEGEEKDRGGAADHKVSRGVNVVEPEQHTWHASHGNDRDRCWLSYCFRQVFWADMVVELELLAVT